MKIGNREILIILLSVGIVLVAFYTILGRGMLTPGESGGYMIMMDQKVSGSDYNSLGFRNFKTTVLLPSDTCEGVVTSCSFSFPEDMNSKEDINGDGIVDYTDLYFAVRSFGCTSNDPCWSDSVVREDCYFTFSDRTFRDPDRNCHITQADIDSVTSQFGKTNTKMTSIDCDTDLICRADVNQDGKVDMYDVALVSANIDKWANVFVNYGYIKKSSADISGSDLNPDGEVDLRDISRIARDMGIKSVDQKCITSDISPLGNRRYGVTAEGKGLYFVSLSYRCS